MKDLELTNLLHLRRDAAPSSLPAGFQQDVWREIRLRRAQQMETHGGWLDWLLEPFRQPAVVCAALALSVLIGAGTALSNLPAGGDHTTSGLHLQVFSSSSPALPSTLLNAH